MADIWYKTGTFLTPASGTTVINTTDKGTNPFAIHVWWTHADTNDTEELGACFGHGFGDGVDEIAMCVAAQHGGSVQRRHGLGTIGGTGNIIAILDPSSIQTGASGTLFVIGTTAAMNANDVTISYSTFTANIIIHYEIWGGADGSANLTTRNDSGTSPFSHGLGVVPDLVLSCTLGQAHPANAQYAFLSFGAAQVGINQWNLLSYWGDNNETDSGSAVSTASIAGQYNLEYANWTNVVTALSSTTMTFTGGTGSDAVCELWLDLGGIGVDVGTFVKSTGGSPATQTLPNFGFTPSGYHLATADRDLETINVQGPGAVFHGAYDGNTGHACGSTNDDGATADRAAWSRTGEVLFGSDNLDINGVQYSATPQAITDATPDVEWNPNTTGGTDDKIIGYYGFENQVAAPLTADGTPNLAGPTAVGSSILRIAADGTPQVAGPTASAQSTQILKPSGALTMAVIAAAGVSVMMDRADGTPNLEGPTAVGVSTQILKPSGTPTLDVITASGVSVIFKRGNGTPNLQVATAVGVAVQTLKPSGSPVLDVITAVGVSQFAELSANGTPNLESPTAVGVSTIFKPATAALTMDVITALGVCNLAPRVWLNATQTLSGATAMTLTANNLAGTSLTFTDPAGSPTGAQFLGIENRNLGGGEANTGWIAVTVNTGSKTANGTPIMEVITAVGVSTIFKQASGSLNAEVITAAGASTQVYKPTGTPNLEEITAVGVSTIFKPGNGTPNLEEITAAGVSTQTLKPSGTPIMDVITASGSTILIIEATGAPIMDAVTAAGVVTQVQKPVGVVTADVITAVGVSTIFKRGNGSPELEGLTAAGQSTQVLMPSGTPSLEVITAVGQAGFRQFGNGTPDLAGPTASGQVVQTQFLSGTLTMDEITASGESTQTLKPSGNITMGEITAVGVSGIEGLATASGNPIMDEITAVGTAKQILKSNGTPQVAGPTASGVVNQVQKPSGTPVMDAITASGQVDIIKPTTGNAVLESPTAVGSVVQTLKPSGNVTMDVITAVGVSTAITPDFVLGPLHRYHAHLLQGKS